MSLSVGLSRHFLNLVSSGKLKQFEESLKDPKKAQSILLDKWNKHKTYAENIQSFEYTSGSSGAKKKVGHTKSLKNSFSDMFQLWAWDILNNAPVKLDSGVIYMSLSPRISEHAGLDNDSEYISPLLRPLVKRFLAVDPGMQSVASGEEFYYQLSKELLARKNLEIISIWSPTYFLGLLDFIENHKKELSFSGAFYDHWPDLKMISAWGSGESQNSASLLKNKFPETWFQPKGLMATEGPMTIPWIKSRGAVPLLNHTYFEFLDKSKNRLLLHELREGEIYEIIPRFPNMQSPYEIGDTVLCTGHYHQTPVLEFCGRTGDGSDLVGEKLAGNILRETFREDFSDFVFLPMSTAEGYFYNIFIDQSSLKTQITPEQVEQKLHSIHHYKLARELNQLKSSRTTFVRGLKKEISNIQLSLGIREGDQKDLTIIKREEIKNALYRWVLSMSSSL